MVLAAQHDQLVKKLGLSDVTRLPTEVCGLAALKSSYVTPVLDLGNGRSPIPPRRAASLGVVYESNAATYVLR